jgi:high-affinity Fe2+/Pb2+ permease
MKNIIIGGLTALTGILILLGFLIFCKYFGIYTIIILASILFLMLLYVLGKSVINELERIKNKKKEGK